MSTPAESAGLLLRLYELRRDPAMRQARDWFVREFHPESIADVGAVLASEHNPKFRMVVGYWDMACSLVVHGAIDQQMFVDACPEAVAHFFKVAPLLEAMRETSGMPFFLRHWETVMRRMPDLEARFAALRSQLAQLRASADEGRAQRETPS
jgi:hypothetical protein